jgi:hypothetical protein
MLREKPCRLLSVIVIVDRHWLRLLSWRLLLDSDEKKSVLHVHHK